MVLAYGVRRLGDYGRKVISGMFAFSSEVPELRIWVSGLTLPVQKPKKIDGVVTQWSLRDEELTDGRIPIVNASSTESPGTPQVCCDNDAIVRLVFQHFRERNFQSLAYLVSPGSAISAVRHEAFVAICQKNGHVPIVIEADKSAFPRADRQLFEKFRSLPKPIGLMVTDDKTGHLVLEACNRLGIRVPDELAVVGVNHEVDLRTHDLLPLSSVDVNAERIGYEAARSLVKQLRGEAVPEVMLLPPLELTARKSSDVTITLDPNLSKALDYMHSHMAERIELEDVLRQQKLSRRTLEMHFKSSFNDSPMKHLRSLRIEKAKFLLETTGLKITEIGRRCGIPDNNYLCRLFRKELNVTPSGYRKMAKSQKGR